MICWLHLVWCFYFLLLGPSIQLVHGQESAPLLAKYDYSEVLHKSYLFYHAQRSGKLKNRRLAWRNDSCFECFGPNGEDLSGGYYEAANTMKWGLPLSFTIMQLAWNVIEFREGHQNVNEFHEGLDAVKWGADYLIQAHPEPFKFYGQLGNSVVDFQYFGPPEKYEQWAEEFNFPTNRPVFENNPSDPGTEIVAQASAALAATSYLFHEIDANYSNLCLQHARELFEFATTYQRSFMESTNPGFETAKSWYPSTGYEDEIILAAIWLYKATGEMSYLTSAENIYDSHVTFGGWGYSWDEKEPAIHILLLQITGNQKYDNYARQYLDSWMPGSTRTIAHTPKGLGYPYHWGANRYSANTAFLCFVYRKYMELVRPGDAYSLRVYNYGVSLVNYMLGDCGRSWIVGFGVNYPKLPYHKSSYNSIFFYPTEGQSIEAQRNDFLFSSTPNRHILYGALVGGPFEDDSYVDNRSDYEYTEVTQDYNAAFTGAVAALAEFYGFDTPFTDDNLDLGWDLISGTPQTTKPPIETPTPTEIPTPTVTLQTTSQPSSPLELIEYPTSLYFDTTTVAVRVALNHDNGPSDLYVNLLGRGGSWPYFGGGQVSQVPSSGLFELSFSVDLSSATINTDLVFHCYLTPIGLTWTSLTHEIFVEVNIIQNPSTTNSPEPSTAPPTVETTVPPTQNPTTPVLTTVTPTEEPTTNPPTNPSLPQEEQIVEVSLPVSVSKRSTTVQISVHVELPNIRDFYIDLLNPSGGWSWHGGVQEYNLQPGKYDFTYSITLYGLQSLPTSSILRWNIFLTPIGRDWTASTQTFTKNMLLTNQS